MPPGKRVDKKAARGRVGSPAKSAAVVRKARAVESAKAKSEWDSGIRVSDSGRGKRIRVPWLSPPRTGASTGSRQGSPGTSANAARNKAANDRMNAAAATAKKGQARRPPKPSTPPKRGSSTGWYPGKETKS